MNTALRWEPFRKVDELFNAFTPFFGRFPFSWGEVSNEPDVGWMPMTDILEADKEYLIKLYLPEVARDKVDVLVEEGVLVIKGERKLEREKGVQVLRSEILYGPFERRFMLPDGVDAKLVKADFKDGVLFVHLPKIEKKIVEPKRIAIM